MQNKCVSTNQKSVESHLVLSMPSNSTTSVDSQATVVIENSNFTKENLPCVSNSNISNESFSPKKCESLLNKSCDKVLPPVPPPKPARRNIENHEMENENLKGN